MNTVFIDLIYFLRINSYLLSFTYKILYLIQFCCFIIWRQFYLFDLEIDSCNYLEFLYYKSIFFSFNGILPRILKFYPFFFIYNKYQCVDIFVRNFNICGVTSITDGDCPPSWALTNRFDPQRLHRLHKTKKFFENKWILLYKIDIYVSLHRLPFNRVYPSPKPHSKRKYYWHTRRTLKNSSYNVCFTFYITVKKSIEGSITVICLSRYYRSNQRVWENNHHI